MLESLLIGAAAAASAPAPVPRGDPIAPLVTLVSPDDYPADAQMKGQQGSVRILIRVDKNGSMSDCVVEESSGFASLDVQTCRLMWMRAKFRPARDKNGNQVASELHQQFIWRLEQDEPSPSQAWAMRTVISLAPGKPPVCRYEFEGALERPANLPSCFTADSTQLPGGMTSGTSDTIEVVEETKFDVGQRPKLGLAAADKLIGSQLVQIDVDTSGNLLTCKIIEASGMVPPDLAKVCSTISKKYKPRVDSKGIAVPFSGYFIFGAYLHIQQLA